MHSSQAEFTSPKTRILIVDNDPRARVSYQMLLMYWDYEPVIAMGEGKSLINDAKAKARLKRCSLSLIDLRLFDDYDEDDFSGIDLAKDLGPVRSIILSGHSNEKILREILRKHKEINFLSKADSPETIRETLDAEAKKVSAAKRGLRFTNFDVLDEFSRMTLGSMTQEYPDQIADVFARLFPDALQLRLEKINSGSFVSRISTVPRPRSVVLKVYEDDFEPYIIKLASAEKMEVEVKNYAQYVSRRVTENFTARLERYANLWDIGGALYSYVGDFNVQTFSRYYEEKPIEDISESLSSFFGVTWSKHYERGKDLYDVSLFDLYDKMWGDWYEKRVRKFAPPAPDEVNRIHQNLGAPEPIAWFKQNIAENREKDISRLKSTRVAVTHGDLHGDNLLVDSKKIAWVIDFERTGEGHILQDFIELESDIINRFKAHDDNFTSLCELCFIVAAQTKVSALEIPETGCKDLRTEKALQTISVLRALAHQCSGIEDAREYLLGLLFNTIFRATIAHKTNNQEHQNRALMVASIFCHRLEHWGEPWPPETWKALLSSREE